MLHHSPLISIWNCFLLVYWNTINCSSFHFRALFHCVIEPEWKCSYYKKWKKQRHVRNIIPNLLASINNFQSIALVYYMNHLTLLTFWVIFKHSLPTSQKAHYTTIMRTSLLRLFKEITTVYFENHMEFINTLWAAKQNVRAAGIYSDPCALKS
jgi:hypothetical protein